MNSKKHTLSRKVLATLLTAAMLITMLPSAMFAGSKDVQTTQDNEIYNLNISKSKHATNLQKNTNNEWQSQVTLSLPADNYKPTVDVVMVIDVSSSMKEQDIDDAKLAAKAMCEELAQKENVETKVGIVTFDKTAHNLTEGLVSISEAENAISNIEASSDTNMMAGLIAGKAMLDSGTGADKYLVLMSDGIPIYWMENGEVVSKTLIRYNKDKETELERVPAGTEPEASKNNFDAMMSIGELLNVKDWDEDSNEWKQVSDTGEDINPDCKYTNIQKATYMTAKYLQQEIFGKYKLKMVAFGTDKYKNNVVYKYGENFCDWIGQQNDVSYYKVGKQGAGGEAGQLAQAFTDIANEIIYVVDAGSKVVDVIGAEIDNEKNEYDFDFIDSIGNINISVGENALEKIRISDGLDANETSRYAFGIFNEDLEGYPFVLHYYENGKDGNSDECIIWDINIPIEIDQAVQLTYSVKLKDPQSEAGTYGTYDPYGDQGGTSLYTNKSATLTTVDSLGMAGVTETFNKPTVSYTIEDQTPITITPADITIYTGGNGYGGVTNEDGVILDDTISTGLPEPGYQITLTDSAINWLKAKLNIESESELKPQDLSKYLSFDYNNDDVTRHWDMAYVGVYATDDDGNPTQFVYSLQPSVDSRDESKTIPVRLLFWEDLDQNGKLNEGENVIDDDDITMTADSVSKQYAMTINPGGLDQSKVQAVLKVNDKEKRFNVNIGTGTLTVKSTTNKETSTEIASSQEDVNSNVIQAVDNGSVIYYVNDSEVAINNATNRVKLLVDEISNSDEFNATMGNDAVDRVEDKFRNDANLSYDTAYMDLVDTENGDTVVTMGDNDSLDIYWPAPDNAAADSDYYIVHYTDMDRSEIDSDVANAETEIIKGQPVTINEHKYIKFNVNSFSPFVLVWNEDTSDGGGSTGGGTTPTPPDLNTEDHFSYVVGYPEDYRTGEPSDNEELWPVKPQGNITRAEVASIFYRLLKDDVRDANTTDVSEFSDVSASDWYGTTVATLSAMDIVRGYEDGTFRPNAPITRAEFAAIATRFFEETGAEYEPGTFDDVTGNEWFANAIADAVELGLIGGYPDGTVRPNNNITRAEACAIVNRTLGRIPHVDHLLPADDMKTWPDNNPSDWFYADMQEATNGHEYEWTTEQGQKVEEWTEILDKDWEDR